jgi:hypothetical protein
MRRSGVCARTSEERRFAIHETCLQRAEKYGDYENEDDNSSARGNNSPNQHGRERPSRYSGVPTTPPNSGKTTVPKEGDETTKQLPDCLKSCMLGEAFPVVLQFDLTGAK